MLQSEECIVFLFRIPDCTDNGAGLRFEHGNKEQTISKDTPSIMVIAVSSSNRN